MTNNGNCTDMREAIVTIRDMLINGGHDPQCRAKIVTICNTVLSATPRNCDVGTSAEQIARFDAECHEIRSRNTVEPCAG